MKLGPLLNDWPERAEFRGAEHVRLNPRTRAAFCRIAFPSPFQPPIILDRSWHPDQKEVPHCYILHQGILISLCLAASLLLTFSGRFGSQRFYEERLPG